MSDISILQEEIRGLNILISPLLVSQLFFEIVGIEHDRRAEEVSKILGLTLLSTYKVFREELLVLLNHQSNERAGRADESTLLLYDLISIGIAVHMVINYTLNLWPHISLLHVEDVVIN